MKNTADPIDFHLVPTTSQRYRISDLSRDEQHAALTAIFDGLGGADMTFRQRLRVTRDVVRELSSFHFETGRLFQQSNAEWRNWFNDIANHADALADLVVKYPDDFARTFVGPSPDQLEQTEDVVNMLLDWARLARRYGAAGPGKPGRKRDMYMVILIDRLSQIYHEATGNKPARSTDWDSGKATGPFVRMMRGVCALGKIDKTDEQIATSIRQWQKW